MCGSAGNGTRIVPPGRGRSLYHGSYHPTAEEGTTVERVQGMVQLTNLNTRQVTTTAEFDGNIARVSLLRGVYSVLVEGSMQYKDAHGATGVRQFRATSDYLEFASKSLNVATLNIVWM